MGLVLTTNPHPSPQKRLITPPPKKDSQPPQRLTTPNPKLGAINPPAPLAHSVSFGIKSFLQPR